MTSKRQTLAEYIQWHEAIRNFQRYRGLSENQRERIQYFNAKKRKVGIILNQILFQVRKSVENEQNYSKIQKIINSAIAEIKTEFDNTNKFTHEKAQADIAQLQTQTDLSRISLNEKMTTQETGPKVLKDSNRVVQIQVRQQAVKDQAQEGFKQAKENSKVREIKSRTSLPQQK